MTVKRKISFLAKAFVLAAACGVTADVAVDMKYRDALRADMLAESTRPEVDPELDFEIEPPMAPARAACIADHVIPAHSLTHRYERYMEPALAVLGDVSPEHWTYPLISYLGQKLNKVTGIDPKNPDVWKYQYVSYRTVQAALACPEKDFPAPAPL